MVIFFTRIYGGPKGQGETLDSHTIMEVGMLTDGQEISKEGKFLAYVTRGSGDINGETVKDGDLIRGENLNFKAANDDVQILVITTED